MNFKLILIGLLLVLFSTTTYAISDTNLIAWWKLDETSGTNLADSKGYDQNLTLNGGTVNQTGLIGKGVSLTNATTQYASGTIPSTPNGISICAWIYPTVGNETGYLFGHGNGINNGIAIVKNNGSSDTAGTYISGVRPGAAWVPRTTTSYIKDTWQFICLTGTTSTDTVKIYLNGNDITTVSNETASGMTNFFFGAQGGTYKAVTGIYDEISYWERELSETDIKDLYNSGNGITYPFKDITADFDYVVDELDVDLTDTSTIYGDAVIDSWEWLIDDVSVSTDQNYSFTGTELTDYNVCLIVQDTVLSLEDSICQTISTGDITPPTTTFSSSQITGTTDQNITLTCTDNNTGCQYINFRINNGDWNYYTIGDNPLTIIYSGTGDHNIQYFSTDNSDNNETTKTSNFTTYGAGKFTFYDEDSLNLLNSINYTITPSINGVSSGTTRWKYFRLKPSRNNNRNIHIYFYKTRLHNTIIHITTNTIHRP